MTVRWTSKGNAQLQQGFWEAEAQLEVLLQKNHFATISRMELAELYKIPSMSLP